VFRDIYCAAYRASRRATPGSIGVLTWLKDLGYRLAIVTNGQRQDQHEKAQAIEVFEVVERIFTSEEIGAAKPDPRIFEAALEALEVEARGSYMVGDCPESDIQGALNVGLQPVLFDPESQETERSLFGKQVPVIRGMGELFGLLGRHE
jgi:HAD superfamily hydrolase (TIGR01509 family)